MKYILIISSIFLFAITACEPNEGNSTPQTSSSTANVSAAPTNNENELLENVMGEWKIDRVYAYGVGGSRNDMDDIIALLGTKILFSANAFKFGNEPEKKPVFYKLSDSSDELFNSNIDWLEKSTLSTDLNVQTLKEISLYEDDQYRNFYYGDGNFTYYSDKGELILEHDGDLFLLVKVE